MNPVPTSATGSRPSGKTRIEDANTHSRLAYKTAIALVEENAELIHFTQVAADNAAVMATAILDASGDIDELQMWCKRGSVAARAVLGRHPDDSAAIAVMQVVLPLRADYYQQRDKPVSAAAMWDLSFEVISFAYRAMHTPAQISSRNSALQQSARHLAPGPGQ